jgi:hypothetical protein
VNVAQIVKLEAPERKAVLLCPLGGPQGDVRELLRELPIVEAVVMPEEVRLSIGRQGADIAIAVEHLQIDSRSCRA